MVVAGPDSPTTVDPDYTRVCMYTGTLNWTHYKLLTLTLAVSLLRQLQLGLLDSILMEQFVEGLWDGVA